MSHDSHGNGTNDADLGLSAFDDISAHTRVLKETMDSAHEVIAKCRQRGLSKKELLKNKKLLPELKGKLKQLLISHLEKMGSIRQLDLEDGSYDNVFIDDELRKLLAEVRNLNTDFNSLIGTRTIRKLTGFIVEDIPYWFTVKWRQLKDNMKQLFKAGALYGSLGSLAAIGGYSIATGDVYSGTALLGKHLGIVGSHIAITGDKIGTLFSTYAPKVKTVMSGVFHKISTLLGGKP